MENTSFMSKKQRELSTKEVSEMPISAFFIQSVILIAYIAPQMHRIHHHIDACLQLHTHLSPPHVSIKTYESSLSAIFPL